MNRKIIFVVLLIAIAGGTAAYFTFVKKSTPFASKEKCEQATGKECYLFQGLCQVMEAQTSSEAEANEKFLKDCLPKIGTWQPIEMASQNSNTQFADEVDEVSDWKTYANTEYKYRINYPPDWEITNITAQPSPAAVRFTKITKQDGRYINDAVVDVIVESNPLKKTPTEEWYREWIKQIPAGMNLEGVQIVETTFQGMRALKIDNHTIFFAKGFNMFRIKWHVAGDYDQSLVSTTENVFNRMLSSFKFFN